jgi:hypothetical protein
MMIDRSSPRLTRHAPYPADTPSYAGSNTALLVPGISVSANDSDVEVVPEIQLVRLYPNRYPFFHFAERRDNGVLKLNRIRLYLGYTSSQTVYYRLEPEHDRKKMWVPVKPSGLQVPETVEKIYFGSARHGRADLNQAYEWMTLGPLELDEFIV